MAENKPQTYTYERAEHLINNMRQKVLTRFCPLANIICRQDCACYVDGEVIQAEWEDVELYYIFEPHCNSPLINGVIEVEGGVYCNH